MAVSQMTKPGQTLPPALVFVVSVADENARDQLLAWKRSDESLVLEAVVSCRCALD